MLSNGLLWSKANTTGAICAPLRTVPYHDLCPIEPDGTMTIAAYRCEEVHRSALRI
jgi:hypothetical protein